MRILFCGDVMGRSGRDGLMRHLPALKKRFAPEVTIVNAENAAGGHGVTLKIAQELLALGIDCLTTGNHVWNQKELLSSIALLPNLLRPLNFPANTSGKGSFLHVLPDGRKLLIANIMGQRGIEPILDDPFATADKLLAMNRLSPALQGIFIDFHAEVTSEKVAMGAHLDGRVSAVVGTHTHIPTADARVLPAGTAFQTDTGMCGDFNSVIGMKKELALWRFIQKTPGERLSPAEGEATICGLFVETNDKTGLAVKAESFQTGGVLAPR
ncbi:MAG: TIGR00282 family metallophosphoesterase [Alphaproteobacteria bacterium]|nr:TIGR00282 family metallophosphoesterase [Alphaproteobacteria bacterium]